MKLDDIASKYNIQNIPDSIKAAEKQIQNPASSTPEVSNIPADMNSNTLDVPTEDAILKEALAMGFDPNYDGPNKVDAKEFVRVGKITQRITSKYEKEMSEMKSKYEQDLRNIGSHLKATREAAYKEALATLEGQMNLAEANLDFNQYRKIQKEHERVANEMQTTLQSIPTPAPAPQQQEVKQWPPEVEQFKKNNPWFDDVSRQDTLAMTQFAVNEYGLQLKNHPTITVQERLRLVEQRVRSAYPEYFTTSTAPSTTQPVLAVEPRTSHEPASSQLNSLTPQQRAIWNSLKENVSGYTLKDYIKDIQLQRTQLQ